VGDEGLEPPTSRMSGKSRLPTTPIGADLREEAPHPVSGRWPALEGNVAGNMTATMTTKGIRAWRFIVPIL